MQIFAPSADPVVSAKVLDDQRLRKMITETAQLLSAAVRLNGGDAEGLYKPPPSGRDLYSWAAHSPENFGWLAAHAGAMQEEALWRFGKVPSSGAVCQRATTAGARMAFLATGATLPINRTRSFAHGVDFTHVSDVYAAYRCYLMRRWELGSPKWTNPSLLPTNFVFFFPGWAHR